MVFDEPKVGLLNLHAVNDLQEDRKLHFTVTDLTTDTVIAKGDADAIADSSVKVLSLPVMTDYHFLLIRWETKDGQKGNNHYVTKLHNISASDYLDDLKKAGYDCFEGF